MHMFSMIDSSTVDGSSVTSRKSPLNQPKLFMPNERCMSTRTRTNKYI